MNHRATEAKPLHVAYTVLIVAVLFLFSNIAVSQTTASLPPIINLLLNEGDACVDHNSVDGDIILANQEDVNALRRVSSVNGTLSIASSTDLDLTPLSRLIDISGSLTMVNNSVQTELSGFDCLTSVGGSFALHNLPSLTSLGGFPALAQVGGSVDFRDLSGLLSLSGFPELENIGANFFLLGLPFLASLSDFPKLAQIGGAVDFRDLNSLSDLSGFPELESIGSNLFLFNNLGFTDISGFNSLTSIGGDFQALNHSLLQSIRGFDQLTLGSIQGSADISSNAVLDCESPRPPFAPVQISAGNFVNCGVPGLTLAIEVTGAGSSPDDIFGIFFNSSISDASGQGTVNLSQNSPVHAVRNFSTIEPSVNWLWDVSNVPFGYSTVASSISCQSSDASRTFDITLSDARVNFRFNVESELLECTIQMMFTGPL